MRAELEALVGPAAVTEHQRRDLWPLGLMRERAGAPAAATWSVRPAEYAQVQRLLEWAGRSGVRVTPIGNLSGVCGAAAPGQDEVALDLRGFDRILDVDAGNLTCHVQAGMLGLALEERLLDRDLTLGHYPSSLPVSTVGGLIATRSSGQESSRWGSIEDMLLGVTAVLPDGTMLLPRPGPRSAAGPALHQLFAGSEGSLGVILDAVLKINRKPRRVIGRGYLFDDVTTGIEVMRETVQRGLRPLVMRLYDREDTAFQGVDGDGCLLVIAFAGEPGIAAAESRSFTSLRQGRGRDAGDEPWLRWRRHRFDLSAERMLRLLEPPGSFLDTIELAAPWSDLFALWSEVKAALAGLGAIGLCHFSHAYPQGCCAYFSFAGFAESEAEAERLYLQAWEAAMAACARNRATITHHHGVGQARSAWIRAEMDGWWTLWSAIRGAADPAGTLNPRAVGGYR